MSFSSDEIKELCDKWCQAVQQSDGSIAIGGQSEQYRLLRNGIQFHDLEFEQLISAISGLTKVLLLRGLNTIVDQDHYGLWSWCAAIILYRESGYFDQKEYEIKKLFETSVRASLAHCRKPTINHDEWQRQNDAEQNLPHHARYFILESSLVLAYLGFPLLESIAKKTCSAYVDMDGTIIKAFQVPKKSGGIRKYNLNSRCCSLRDLLFLIYDQLADSILKAELTEFRDHISTLDNSEDAFDVIYNWRNQSLHGSTSFQTIGGTLLNLSLLICICQLKDRFQVLKESVIDQCRREIQHAHKSPWSFYPPY